jgi:hypothetical protein
VFSDFLYASDNIGKLGKPVLIASMRPVARCNHRLGAGFAFGQCPGEQIVAMVAMASHQRPVM